MPPRRWTMGRQTEMSAGIRRFLLTGDYGRAREFDYDAFQLRGNVSALEALWARHGAALLEDWVGLRPGCRPHAWWVTTAREPRRVIRGAELQVGGPALAAHWWRPRHGVPFFLQTRPRDFVGLPTIEAEPTYLARLQHFGEGERARVAAEAWAPVAIDPFVVDRLASARAATSGSRHGRAPRASTGHRAPARGADPMTRRTPTREGGER